MKSHTCVPLLVTPWTAGYQASHSMGFSRQEYWSGLTLPSPTSSWSWMKLMSIESVMPSNHLILCPPLLSCLQSVPAPGSFPMSQYFASCGQSTGASSSASVLPLNIQNWFPLGLTAWISLQSKGLSRVFSSNTVQKHQVFGAQLSLWSNSTAIHDYWKNHSLDQTELCWQSNVYAFQYAIQVGHNFPSKE